MLPTGGVGAEKTKSVKKMTGLWESVRLLVLDAIVFGIIFIVYGIIYLAVTASSSIAGFLKVVPPAIWGALTGGK